MTSATHLGAACGVAAPARHRVVTYFIDRNVEGHIVTEWRVFDPVTRVDTLFAAVSARSIYWDEAQTIAEYVSGGQSFRIRWEYDAQPWPVQRPQGDDVRDSRVDTGSRWIPAVDLLQLQNAMSLDAWGGKPEVILPPHGEEAAGAPWIHIACRGVPGRGLAYRVGRDPRGQKSLVGPLYLVDRSRSTEQRLDTPRLRPGVQEWPEGFEEHDGYLLISGTRTFVFDLRSGEQILPNPCCGVRQAVWILSPAPPSVDRVGLRRLRERFR